MNSIDINGALTTANNLLDGDDDYCNLHRAKNMARYLIHRHAYIILLEKAQEKHLMEISALNKEKTSFQAMLGEKNDLYLARSLGEGIALQQLAETNEVLKNVKVPIEDLRMTPTEYVKACRQNSNVNPPGHRLLLARVAELEGRLRDADHPVGAIQRVRRENDRLKAQISDQDIVRIERNGLQASQRRLTTAVNDHEKKLREEVSWRDKVVEERGAAEAKVAELDLEVVRLKAQGENATQAFQRELDDNRSLRIRVAELEEDTTVLTKRVEGYREALNLWRDRALLLNPDDKPWPKTPEYKP